MYEVQIKVHVPGVGAHSALAALGDIESFPALTDTVHAVTVQNDPDGQISSWQVDFAGGVLKWRERDHLDEQRLRIDFDLVDGDLPHLAGAWVVHPSHHDCEVEFHARFDLGVPGMADVLEPVAGRALTNTVISILRGVFGPGVVVTEQAECAVQLSGAADARE